MQKDPNMRYQSAEEMLYDLDLALKKPDGDFVELNKKEVNASPTQKIPTIKEVDTGKRVKTDEKK